MSRDCLISLALDASDCRISTRPFFFFVARNSSTNSVFSNSAPTPDSLSNLLPTSEPSSKPPSSSSPKRSSRRRTDQRSSRSVRLRSLRRVRSKPRELTSSLLGSLGCSGSTTDSWNDERCLRSTSSSTSPRTGSFDRFLCFSRVTSPTWIGCRCSCFDWDLE